MMARCWDDTCAVSEADCPCPPWMPAKCDDGTCMMSASECPCPTTTPMKCWDDTCAISHADCPCPPEMPAEPGERCMPRDWLPIPCVARGWLLRRVMQQR